MDRSVHYLLILLVIYIVTAPENELFQSVWTSRRYDKLLAVCGHQIEELSNLHFNDSRSFAVLKHPVHVLSINFL